MGRPNFGDLTPIDPITHFLPSDRHTSRTFAFRESIPTKLDRKVISINLFVDDMTDTLSAQIFGAAALPGNVHGELKSDKLVGYMFSGHGFCSSLGRNGNVIVLFQQHDPEAQLWER